LNTGGGRYEAEPVHGGADCFCFEAARGEAHLGSGVRPEDGGELPPHLSADSDQPAGGGGD